MNSLERSGGSSISVIPDDPISTSSADHLNRTVFAKSIAKLITGAPAGSSFRIAVYGEWGSGKTSVLRLIQEEVRSLESVIPVWYVPWGVKSTEAMWEMLIRDIASALGIEQGWIRRCVSYVSHQISKLRPAVSELDWKFKIADKALGPIINTVGKSVGHAQKQHFLKTIQKELDGKRLIVFIDDLDRVTPHLIPGLLLALRQALDFPNTFFVLGLSRAVIEDALAQVHPGWEEAPEDFLEKIIEYPTFLPGLTTQDVEQLVNSFLRNDSTLRVELLTSLCSILPHNPRQVKLFLRLLYGLQGEIARFSEGELDHRALYLAQLLRIEFPQEARRLAKDTEVVRAMERSAFRFDEEDAQTERMEEKYAPEEEQKRERFLTICDALRENRLLGSDYSLSDLILLIESPPVLTWKEVLSVFERFRESTDTETLHVCLAKHPTDMRTLIQTLWPFTLRLYKRILEEIADADTESEMQAMVEEDGYLALELIKRLLTERQFLKDRLTVDEWMSLNKLLKKWSDWRTFPYYESLREIELDLIMVAFDALDDLGKRNIVDMLGDDEFEITSVSDNYQSTLEEIENQSSIAASEAVLQTFKQSDGLSRYMGDTAFKGERRVAFNPESHFHRDPFRSRLLEVLKGASENESIHLNALRYLRTLYYGASQGGNFRPSWCEKLLRDEDLIKPLWKAATERVLNPRIAGTLHEYRNAMISNLGVSPEALPIPFWFQRLIDVGFLEQPEEQGGNNEQEEAVANESDEGTP